MLRLGDVVDGRYRIDAVIGHGGMSVVYRATHLQLGQPVAVKVLFAPEQSRRLAREARVAACIRGENVVRVFDMGLLPTGAGYLVMEFVEGEDLAALLAREQRLTFAVAVDYVLQACEGVAQAHALGIVHRDLKPANLLLTERPDGTPLVKVLDFGISRGPGQVPSSNLTDPGIVFGTPSYMAPEQMEGRDADQRVDVWALGAILYEMIVGRPPFAGDVAPRVFMEIMSRNLTRPSAVRNDVPRGLDTVIARCLAVDPNARFASVVELAWALADLGSVRARDRAARIARTWTRGRALGPVGQELRDVERHRPTIAAQRGHLRRWRPPLRVAIAGTALVAIPALTVVARSYGSQEPPPRSVAAASSISDEEDAVTSHDLQAPVSRDPSREAGHEPAPRSMERLRARTCSASSSRRSAP